MLFGVAYKCCYHALFLVSFPLSLILTMVTVTPSILAGTLLSYSRLLKELADAMVMYKVFIYSISKKVSRKLIEKMKKKNELAISLPPLIEIMVQSPICRKQVTFVKARSSRDQVFFLLVRLSPDFHELWRSMMSICLLTEVKRQWATLVLGWVTV